MTGAKGQSGPDIRSWFVKEAVSQATLDQDAVLHALWALNAPRSMIAGQFLFGRLQKLLGDVEWRSDLSDPDRALLEQLDELSVWMNDEDVTLPAKFAGSPFLVEPEQRKVADSDDGKGVLHRNPVDGHGMSRHPVYAMLMHTCEDVILRPVWDGMAIHVALATARVFREHVSLDEYLAYAGQKEHPNLPGSFDAGGRSMRVLSAYARARQMDQLADVPMNESFGSRSYRLLAQVGRENEELRTVLRLLARCHGHMEWPDRQGGGAGGNRSKEREHGYIELGDGRVVVKVEAPDPDDPETDEFVEEVISDTGDDDEDDGDDSPGGETPDPRGVRLIGGDCKDTKKSPASIALAAKGRDNATRRHAQHLGWDYRILTLHEVHELDCALRSRLEALLTEKIHKLPPEDLEVLELSLQILICLWKGTDLLVARGLRLLTDKSSAPKSRLCFFAVRCPDTNQVLRYEWRNEARMPNYKGERTLAKALSRPQRGTCWLPDIADLGRMVAILRAAKIQGREQMHVFRTDVDPDEHRSAARRFIRSLEISDRTTLEKVESYVKGRISAVKHDPTAAALICNRNNQESRVRLFYTLVSNALLREHYVDVIAPDVPPEVRQRVVEHEGAGQEETAQWYVGARQCVTQHALRNGVEALKNRVQQASHYRDLDGLIAFHNLYVTYVVWFFAFAICGRAVNSLYFGADQVDPVTGISSVRDKDSEFPYHAKFAWFAPIALAQMRLFDQHIQRIRALQVMHNITPGGDASFYLSPTLRASVVQPKGWRQHMRPFIDMPMNGHRRFICTTLVEKTKAIESKDLVMGHWNYGEEPWDQDSSFEFQDHIDFLKAHLVPLIDEAGFEVLHSPLVLN